MFADTRRIAGKPSKRQLAQIDRQIDAIYNRIGRGVQINMMDIGKIFNAGRGVATAGPQAMENAVAAAIAQLRQN